MSNDKNFSGPGIFVSHVLDADGTVNVAAMVSAAQEQVIAYATSHNGSNAKVKEILDTRIWDKAGGAKGRCRMSPSQIATGVLVYLNNPVPTDKEVLEMESRVNQMMANDSDFFRVVAGRSSGWHAKFRYVGEKGQALLKDLLKQAEEQRKRRAEKAAKKALGGTSNLEEIVDIDVEEDSSAAAQ